MSSSSSPAAPRATRRELWAWASYDWANSAFSTLSITIVVAYIQKVVFPEAEWGSIGATVWAWGIAGSMLAAAILSPITGALADARANKRGWLAATALGGAAAGLLLAAAPPDRPWLVTGLFVITAFMFELSLGYYNGFLPEIANEHDMNRVSAWGFALGYIGGGVALIFALLVVFFGESVGIASRSDQLRIGILIMALWWGLFSLPAVWVLRDRSPPRRERASMLWAMRQALGEVKHTLANIRRFRTLAFFLVGFLFYNDGVQTVISQASTFAIRVLEFTDEELIGVILMIQFLAFPGAMLVGWLSDRVGQKAALHGCLAVWVGLLVVAYFINTKAQFWILGVVVAMVMGGIQSVSRAIMGRMTPARHAAEFFGFFNLSGKATSFLGTFTFGLVIATAGSARLAIVSLLVFFFIGWALIFKLDFNRGQQEALAAER